MAISIGATVTTDTGGTGNDRTYSHTVDSDTTLLIVFIGKGNNNSIATINAVTWNTNESLTQLPSGQATYSQYYATDVWYLVNPTATTANIVVDHDVSGMTAGSVCVNLLGTATSSPISGATTATGTTDASNAVSSSTGDLVMDILFCVNDPTVGSGQTERGSVVVQSVRDLTVSSEAGASSVTMDWTGNGNYAWTGFSVGAAGAGTGTKTASVDAAIAPQTPSGLQWTGKSQNEVTVSFTDNTGGTGTHYIFYKLSSDSQWTLDGSLPAGDTTHTVYYLASGFSYDFAVAAYSGSIIGPFDTITTSTVGTSKLAALDAALQTTRTGTVALDALLTEGTFVSVGLDALLFGTATKTVGLNAYVQDLTAGTARRVTGRFV